MQVRGDLRGALGWNCEASDRFALWAPVRTLRNAGDSGLGLAVASDLRQKLCPVPFRRGGGRLGIEEINRAVAAPVCL